MLDYHLGLKSHRTNWRNYCHHVEYCWNEINEIIIHIFFCLRFKVITIFFCRILWTICFRKGAIWVSFCAGDLHYLRLKPQRLVVCLKKQAMRVPWNLMFAWIRFISTIFRLSGWPINKLGHAYVEQRVFDKKAKYFDKESGLDIRSY